MSTRVHACIPAFELVYVRTPEALQFVLTPDTEGVRLEELAEGHAVECLVSSGLQRVLSTRLKR